MVWAIGLLILGLAFVLAEVFFPSLGAFSIIATACIIGADVIAFGVDHAIGYGFIMAEIVLVPLVVYTGFKVLPHTSFGQEMLLEGPQTTGPGVPDLLHLLHAEGEAMTRLGPSGTGRFGDERVSVVAQGPVLDPGTRIRVVHVEGSEVRVRAVTTPAAAADGPSF